MLLQVYLIVHILNRELISEFKIPVWAICIVAIVKIKYWICAYVCFILLFSPCNVSFGLEN